MRSGLDTLVMRAQYTVTNWGIPGTPVVIRTHDRAVALRMGRGWNYRITLKCLERARWGLATMEKRAASVVQYDILGRDQYMVSV